MLSPPQKALVDTGSELTWLPADVRSAVGITRRRERQFATASKQILRRQVGYAIATRSQRERRRAPHQRPRQEPPLDARPMLG